MYDIIVIGCGVIGASVAYELSKYNLNIAVIEKEYDIADDVSFVNTSIVEFCIRDMILNQEH